MSEQKITQLKIRADRPTAIASSAHGSSLDAIGFNIAFLAARNPMLAVEAMKLYELAHLIKEDYPPSAEEDFELFADEVGKILADDKNKEL
jgi:hypothetical protein